MKRPESLPFWGYTAQLSGLLGFLLLPLLLRSFSVEKVALWFLVVTVGALATLAEQSLEPAVTRYVTYARRGVEGLPYYGMSPSVGSGALDARLLANVVSAARQLYAWAATLNFLVLGVGGAWYLWTLASQNGLGAEISRAWAIFVAAQYLGCRLAVNIPILQGMGRPAEAFQALTFQRITFLVVAATGLLLRPCLEVIGIAQIVAVTIGPGMAWLRARRLLSGHLTMADKEGRRECVREIFRGSIRLWTARGGAFLIVKSNLLLVSGFLGLAIAGRLALSMQALEALNLVASTPLFAQLPKLYDLKALGHIRELKQRIGTIHLLGWGSFLLGGSVILWFGEPLLELLGSRSTFLPRTALLLMLATGFLEMNHSLSATLLMLGNRVPFVRAAVLSGLATIVISSILLTMTGLGVMGALLVSFCVQLSYNNWKWPVEALRFLDTSYGELIRLGYSRRS